MKRIVLLTAVLVLVDLAHTQENSTPDFTFNHMVLPAKDVDASVSFSTKVLEQRQPC